MILTKSVNVNITNNAKFYKKYGNLKQGQTINVLVSDLPTNSNKIVAVKCDECSVVFDRNLQNLNKRKEHLCYACARISAGKKMKLNINRPEFEQYKSTVYKLTNKIYWDNLDIINPNGLPRTLCGVEGGYQLDHIVSIKEGFDKNITPKIIANVNNLQMLTWQANRSKWHYK